MSSTSQVADTILKQSESELLQSLKDISEIKSKYMKEPQPELRPPEFSEHLWSCVFDSQNC